MAEPPAEDPWAPLPTGELSLHPGEAAAPRSTVAAAPSAVPAEAASPAAAAPVAPPAPTPEQERALAELAAKVAQQRQPASLVGQVLQREHRQQHKQARARKLREAGRGDLDAPVPAVAVPPAGTVVHGASADGETPPERDPRLSEPWFLSLPSAEQERLRKAWRHQHERQLLDQPHHVRERHRRSVSALLTFAVVAVLGGASAFLAMCAGVLTAIWWRYTRPGRFGDPVTAVTCFYVVHAIGAIVHGGVSPALVFDSILVVAIAALVGFSGEMRSSGGFVD